MLRIKNPFFVTPDQATATRHKPAVLAWMQGQTTNKIITMAELRAALPAIAGELTRTVVNQICADIGADIENPEDGQA